MYWQVSKLILRMWRNRARRLVRQYPALWALVVVLPLIYGGGGYLLHAALYRVLSTIAANPHLLPNTTHIIAFSSFGSFGLTAFLLFMLISLFSPDDTTLSRVLASLPLTAHQRYIGIVLPGILCLFLAQLLLWAPVFGAFVRALPLSAVQLCLGAVLGLGCYTSLTALLYQAALYGTTRAFGAQRVALKSTALPLVVIIGIVGLLASQLAGGTLLLSGRSSLWVWGLPAFWMSLVLSDQLIDVGVGLGLLIGVALVSGLLHKVLLTRTARLADGTRGGWVPLRRIPFGKHRLPACCVYEWKTASRDQQVVMGVALMIGLFLVVAGVIVWLQSRDTTGPIAIIMLITGYLSALCLCTIAHMSWGRDREQRRVLAGTPLMAKTLISGKVSANVLALSGIWLLLMGSVVVLAGQFTFLNTARLLPLGALLAFFFGIIVPFSLKDPLSIIVAVSVFLVFGVPLQFILQEIGALVQQNIVVSERLFAVFSWIFYLAVCMLCYRAILWMDQVRERERYE